MSDNDRESHETVVAISTDDAAGPGTDDDAGDGSLAPLHVGEASVGGERTYPLVIRDRRYQESVLLHWTRPTLLDLQRQLFR